MNPITKKICLQLNPPKSGDVIADKERLLNALMPEYGKVELEYTVFRRDYRAFREQNWLVTVTLVWVGDSYIISQIEAGDTAKEHYGIAVDLGSTMVAAELIDLSTGKTVAAEGAPNPQISFGEDILSRITYGKDNEEHLQELQKCVLEAFDRLLDILTEQSGIDAKKAGVMIVGGNTTMIHLLMGIDAFCVFMTPFTPTFNDIGFVNGMTLGLSFRSAVYCVPSVANYLGGDIIGGLLTVDLTESDKLGLYMDIGTNGEMVLGNKEFLFAGAGAAGPALEGGVSKFGMRAKSGAVSKIVIEDDIVISTIDDAPAVGICGSGIVDLLAEMLINGWMDKQGKLISGMSERIKEVEGEKAVVYALPEESASGKELYFTEADILAFRDTKAAANTMVALLLEAAEISPEDVDVFYAVGGFGEHINLESAITIGMYPDVDRSKFKVVGNGSLKGARLLLTDCSLLNRIDEICKRIYYLEFAQFPDFIIKMGAAGFFPHTDLETYPSVLQKIEERKTRKKVNIKS